MLLNRQFGLLLHPTSLPGPLGVGDIGDSARVFIQILKEMGAGVWQILPLNNPGYGFSPYSSDSAFACNPALIDLKDLKKKGLIDASDIPSTSFTLCKTDYGKTLAMKLMALRKAFNRFRNLNLFNDRHYSEFISEHAFWLNDFALFSTIKESQNGASWLDWPNELKHRQPDTLQRIQDMNSDSINFHKFIQYVFFTQWQQLKQFASDNNILIIGDLPIFVSYDSADVWANTHLFDLDADKNPKSIAGVPPDYFSSTGQKWGNPHYNWDNNRQTDYRWWKQRVRVLLSLVDIIRIDHFRGFEAFWVIPAHAPTAETGIWKQGPGESFFSELKKTFGLLPIIAENLGVITSEVEALRHAFGFPGMRVLQFAFDDQPSNTNLFFHHHPNDVVYTGTHDNNTILGWWQDMSNTQRCTVQKQMETLLGHSVTNIVTDMIRIAMGSVCNLAVIPLQDILQLPASARMNKPGTTDGNWLWQMTDFHSLQTQSSRLRSLALAFDRLANPVSG